MPKVLEEINHKIFDGPFVELWETQSYFTTCFVIYNGNNLFVLAGIELTMSVKMIDWMNTEIKLQSYLCV